MNDPEKKLGHIMLLCNGAGRMFHLERCKSFADSWALSALLTFLKLSRSSFVTFSESFIKIK